MNEFNNKKLLKILKAITNIGITLFIIGIIGREFLCNPFYLGLNSNFRTLFTIFAFVGLPSALIASVVGYYMHHKNNTQTPTISQQTDKANSSKNIETTTQNNTSENLFKNATPNCDDDACSTHNANYDDVCNYCGSKLDKNQSVCSQCGQTQEIKCKKCGTMNKCSSTYCTNCDSKLD